MRCSNCNFDNVAGMATCQVCGSSLIGEPCERCGFDNPPDYRFCGSCGRSLVEPEEPAPVTEVASAVARPPRRPADTRPSTAQQLSRGPSPIALIGFGAILALGSIAFPWYLFGATQASEGQSLSNILETGWQWFPGVPLLLIAASTIASTLAGLLGSLARARPIVAVVAGMVTLIAATWLWQGYSGPSDGSGADTLGPTTGAMLATVGAIVLVAAGLWMRSIRPR